MNTDNPTNLLPTGAEGNLRCARCGAPARRGWVYYYGKIVLATCNKVRCEPANEKFFVACTFYTPRRPR